MIDRIFYGVVAAALAGVFLLGPGGPLGNPLAFENWAVWTGGIFAMLTIAVLIREGVR